MLFRKIVPVAGALVLAISASMLVTLWPLDLVTCQASANAESKATGALTVKIKPKAARSTGARWRVDSSAWQKSGRTVSGLSTGQHTVTFKSISGWNTPNSKQVNIAADQTTDTTGKYTPSNDLTVFLPGNVPLVLVWVPAGSFDMGRSPNEQDSASNEDPQHSVTLTQGFRIGKYEVTKRQWTALMGTTPWSGYPGVLSNLDSPAVYISWNDAQAFVTALNTYTSQTFRLPSEAQWEYACRAVTITRFYWGDDATYTSIDAYAWWSGNAYDANERYAHVVGLKLPNAWGLYDMSGNVYEWCEDWYAANAYPSVPDTDPMGPASGQYRVVRGGSWYDAPTYCRSASRSSYEQPTFTANDVGFRIAR